MTDHCKVRIWLKLEISSPGSYLCGYLPNTKMTYYRRRHLNLFLLPSFITAMASNPSLIPSNLLAKLTSHANSFAAANGLQVETKKRDTSEMDKVTYETAPISLLPNAYPAKAFASAQELSPSFNLLVDRISRDGDWLNVTLSNTGVADVDPFTGELLRMYQDIYCNDRDQGRFARSADRLGIMRSDYMLHTNNELKQVELNTIASSFAGLAVNVAKLHRHLVKRFKKEEQSIQNWLEQNKKIVLGLTDESCDLSDLDGVPENPALDCLPASMKVAHDRYLSRFDTKSNSPVILFVVQEGETNTVDQRMLEFQLYQKYEIPVVRMSLTAGFKNLKLNENDGTLNIVLEDGSMQEVSVVYFRAGYAPTDYPGDNGEEWHTRKKIELSRATKCPCLGYHLAGTKKVQQALARPGNLERFFSGSEHNTIVPLLRSAFAGLYSLGADSTEVDKEAVKDAITGNEGNYVLKPQREGGGYNYYGDRLAKKLSENVSDEMDFSSLLAEFILMERLFPPKQNACLLRAGKIEGIDESISELGCFGTIVATESGEVAHNEYAGFLLRTKFSGVDEGGVASGFATLSSPFLCNE